jgi:hypothetical protein
MKRAASLLIGALLLTGTAHAQYKQCQADWMSKGRDIVAETCGRLDAQAVLADQTAASEDQLNSAYSAKEKLNTAAKTYAACVQDFITTGMMSNLELEKLDYATCAHQWAEEQRTEARISFGMACIAWEDKTGRVFSQPCFPKG